MWVNRLVRKSAAGFISTAFAAAVSLSGATPAQADAIPSAPSVSLVKTGSGAWTVSWTPTDNLEITTGWDVHVFDKDGEIFFDEENTFPNAPTHTCSEAVADQDITSCDISRVVDSEILVTVAASYGDEELGDFETVTSDELYSDFSGDIHLSLTTAGVQVQIDPQDGVDSFFVTAQNISISDEANDVTLDVSENLDGTWTVTNVESQDDIQVSVQPVVAGITSAQVFISDAFTMPSIPGAPRTVRAVLLSVNTATISWTAPADNGGTAITGYTVTSTPSGASCPVSGVALTCVASGLTSGTSYTFNVVARHQIGAGPASAPSTALAMPGTPTGVTIASMASITATKVSFAALTPAPPNGYEIAVTSGTVTNKIPCTTNSNCTINTDWGKTYSITVAGKYGSVIGSSSAPITYVTVAKPATPALKVVWAKGKKSFVVNFVAPAAPATSTFKVVLKKGKATVGKVSCKGTACSVAITKALVKTKYEISVTGSITNAGTFGATKFSLPALNYPILKYTSPAK
jgi:hypothetical protein